MPPSMKATSDDVNAGLGERRRAARGRPCCGEWSGYGDYWASLVRSVLGGDRQYNVRGVENEARYQTAEVADSWPASGLRRLPLTRILGRIGPPTSANACRV
jgi:hypothetical protein